VAIAADADAGAAQHEEEGVEEEAQAAASPLQLAGTAALFGCKRCTRAKAGCISCRPKVAAVLVSLPDLHTQLTAWP
jgi:hypothetical protein